MKYVCRVSRAKSRNPHARMVQRSAALLEEKFMSAVKRSAAHKYEDGAVYWDKDSTGVVEEVHDTGDGVYISVRSDEKMRVGDKMCLTADHEVLTDKGWKIISEVKVNDKTASLNPQGLVEYTSVESTHHYDDSELFQAGMLMTSTEHMLAGIENRGENGTEKMHQNEDRHDGSCAHARKLENNEPESAKRAIHFAPVCPAGS